MQLLSFNCIFAIIDETSMNAYNQVEFLRYALIIYSRTVESVIYIIGDNCAFDQRIADDFNVPLIGCASHRFNLEMQKFEPILQKIKHVMKKMMSLKNAALFIRRILSLALLNCKKLTTPTPSNRKTLNSQTWRNGQSIFLVKQLCQRM